MSIKKVFAAAMACAALVGTAFVSEAVAQTTWTSNRAATHNGYDYELWGEPLNPGSNNIGTVSMRLTGDNGSGANAKGGTFECSWQGTKNILFRSGRKWQNNGPTPQSLGNITIDFVSEWNSIDGAKMLSVYGWAYYAPGNNPTAKENGAATSFSNQIEYYIIQDRGGYNPASGNQNGNKDGEYAKKYGEATIDGIVYEFWVADRIQKWALTGNGDVNFKQYFSVPKYISAHRTSGMITVSKHFEEWNKLEGMKFNGPMYEIAMKIESYTGGNDGSGTGKMTKNLLTIGGDLPSNPCDTNPSGPGCGNTGDGGKDTPTDLTWGGGGAGNLLTSSWTLNAGSNHGGSKATGAVNAGNGSLKIDPMTQGGESWEPQLVQKGISLEAGKTYQFTFSARTVSGSRSITAMLQEDGGDYAPYGSKDFSLTTTAKLCTLDVTMTSADAAAQLAINLGGSNVGVILSNPTLVAPSVASILPGTSASSRVAPTVSVRGGMLNVFSPNNSELTVRMIDVRGRVRARFNAPGVGNFSLASTPPGRYFVEVKGSGVRQTLPIVVK